MRAGGCVDQLAADTHPAPRFADAAFEHVADPHQHHGPRTADRSDQGVAPAVRTSLLARFHRSKRDSAHARAIRVTTAAGACELLRSAPKTPTAARHPPTSRFRTAWTQTGPSRRSSVSGKPLSANGSSPY